MGFKHTRLRGKAGGGHTGQPDGKSIGAGSGNSSMGMADHHGAGRSGLSGAGHSFKGMNKSPTCSCYDHGGHKVGRK